MKEIKITKRQKTVLEKIKNFMMENSYPPTIRDIAREFGFSSPKAVTDHLKSLERKGFIERNSLARSIKLTGKALDMLDGVAAWRNDGRGTCQIYVASPTPKAPGLYTFRWWAKLLQETPYLPRKT